jgi:hypothetical protein
MDLWSDMALYQTIRPPYVRACKTACLSPLLIGKLKVLASPHLALVLGGIKKGFPMGVLRLRTVLYGFCLNIQTTKM